MNERDKFLTLARGFVWDEEKGYYTTDAPVINNMEFDFISYSNWEGFGQLWEFISTHPARWEMAGALKCGRSSANGGKFLYLTEELMHPDRLANAVYEFLKERNNEG